MVAGPIKNAFTIREAQTNLSRLLARAGAGEVIILARAPTQVARNLPLTTVAPRQPGRLKGELKVGAELFDPLAEDEVAAWE